MTYSIDLRERVCAFVREDGSKAEAERRFKVSRKTIYNWLGSSTLEPKKHGHRNRKLDWHKLRQHVAEYPDALLRERAATFGVRISSIEYALEQMDISHKKNAALRRKGLRRAHRLPAALA
jgi:putative transposase